MSKRALLPLILILSLLTAGCQALPEVISAVESITSPSEALPTETLTAESDETSVPTATLAEPTATELPPTETPTATPTETPEPIFVLQPGSPMYMANFAHPAAGCDWSGVGGQVFDSGGTPVAGLFVIAGDDTGQLWAAQTGLSTAYGPGGYELQITEQVTGADQLFWLQVVNDSGQPLSEQVYFNAFQDCGRNLVLINFESAATDAAPHTITTPAPTATLEAYP
ncbi:MAG: hypothetical protein H0S79_03970 [Anaerolineaceae bacterium]|nr:hypothetical protein [Anaerolineaceae bacterium]